MTGEEFEKAIEEGGFLGCKVYLSNSPRYIPENEIRIFDYLPYHQLEVLNRRGWIVMLHIPRPGRLKDPVNLAQMLEIEEKYPHVKLIIAHVGRAYCNEDIGNAFEVLAGTKNMLFSSIIEMMQAQLKYYGYPGMVYYNDEYENEVDAAARICRERKPVAIAFLGGNMQNFNDALEKISIPCILVTNSGEHIKADNLSSVTTDDEEAARFAINCLIENGHRRIGVIGGNIDISNTSKLRAEGCD
jgi:hypothetical protein